MYPLYNVYISTDLFALFYFVEPILIKFMATRFWYEDIFSQKSPWQNFNVLSIHNIKLYFVSITLWEERKIFAEKEKFTYI